MLSFRTVGLLKVRYFLLLVSFFFSFCTYCQLSLNFETVFPGNIRWEGSITNFKINTEGQLQLNALQSGESGIFTKYKIPPDSLQIDLYFKMLFAPSNDNFAKIYLFLDKTTEISANGYYLKLGENGSNDAIQLWKLTNGTPTLLGSASMGAISGDPSFARLQIKIYRTGLWVLQTDYKGKTMYEDDLEVFEPSFFLPDSMYFGLYCKYTATRIDKFFYDDISIKSIEKDTSAPVVNFVEVIDANSVQIIFSESLDEFSAKIAANYSINNGLGSPDFVLFSSSMPTNVILKYNSKTISSGVSYLLNVSGIKDKKNNQKNSIITFIYKVKPEKGDIVITEVLTDPYSGGDDFVELYNKSNKFLKLDSIRIVNAQKNESRVISTNYVLNPGKYVAVSRNIAFLKSKYETPDSASFIAATLPSLNVDAANISLISVFNSGQVTVDSFDYNEKMHFSLIDEKKGISLERINILGTTNDVNNWHSASSQSKYGTPGYKNSNFLPTNTQNDIGIFPDKKVFTPNGDGVDDFVLLGYKVDKQGYLATIRVYDTEGFLVSDLTNNFLLGTEGVVKWDGTDQEGKIVRIGMYLVYSRIFHPDGEVREFKSVLVAADSF